MISLSNSRLALLAFLAATSARAEGWGSMGVSNIWPSTNHYSIYPTNTLWLTPSNLWVAAATDAWAIGTSVSNFIPRIVTTNSTTWPFYGPIQFTNSFTGVTHRVWTNIYIAHAVPDASTNLLNSWTQDVVYTTSVTNPFTVCVTNHRTIGAYLASNGVPFRLDARHLWAWECYEALAERFLATTAATNPPTDLRRGSISDTYKPRFVSREAGADANLSDGVYGDANLYLNCARLKNMAYWLLPYFRDTTRTNELDLATNDVSYATASWSDSSVSVAVGAPTNYFNTGFRSLSSLAGWYGLDRIVSGKWYNYTLKPVTQTCTATWGDYTLYNVIIAPTSYVAFASTNTSIEIGRNTSDYGLRYLPLIVNKLTDRVLDTCWITPTDGSSNAWTSESWYPYSSWAAAIATTNFPYQDPPVQQVYITWTNYVPPQRWTSGTYADDWGFEIWGSLAFATAYITAMPVHVLADLSLQARGGVPRALDPPEGGTVEWTFDAGSVTGLTTNWAALYTAVKGSNVVAWTNSSVTEGPWTTNISPYVGAPDADTWTIKGYKLESFINLNFATNAAGAFKYRADNYP